MRFSYYHSPQKEAKVYPSPDRYAVPGLFGSDFSKIAGHVGNGKNNMYSFGVSRMNMQTLHVDDINKNDKKRLLPPGPGNYEPRKTFGTEGNFKSFHSRLNYDTRALKKQSETPGPAHYSKTEVLSRNLPVSVHPSAVGQAFSKAQDRFAFTRQVKYDPGPGNYSPKVNFKEEEVKTKNPRAAIGRTNFSILDDKYNMREKKQVPGPGAYARFSDFGQKLI